MANALYYTLSTIAQTLGGAFALLGAFVLFGLQIASARIEKTADVVRQAVALGSEEYELLAKLFLEGRWRDLFETAKDPIERAAVASPHILIPFRELGRLLALTDSLRHSFYLSAATTITTLIVSVAGLAWSDKALQSPTCAAALILTCVVLFVLCLFTYARVLILAVGKSAV